MKRSKIILSIFILLIAWIIADINYPFKTDIRSMNAIDVADKETAMWQSYYEKKPVKLFMQSAALMRSEFHFPFWRSHLVSYHAAAAAFIFKGGSDRIADAAALHDLTNYFRHISDISTESFNADSAAKYELEWWLIRRERDKYKPGDWEEILCKAASTVYHVPPGKFSNYAHLRVEAMLLRMKKQIALQRTTGKMLIKF